jgi:hypothetical protein
VKGEQKGYSILMSEQAVLNRAYKGAYDTIGITASKRSPERSNLYGGCAITFLMFAHLAQS